MRKFEISRYEIKSDKGKTEKKDSAGHVRAVFLSDLHNVSYGTHNELLLRAIKEEHPDLILITGDMLTSGKKVEKDEALFLLKELSAAYPVYYSNGNHEQRMKFNRALYHQQYEEYAQELKSYGIHLLENEKEELCVNDRRICIHGLEIPMKCFKKGVFPPYEASEIRNVLGVPGTDAFQILLAHHPLYAKTYAKWGADLSLSGHLHGGIVRLPFFGGVISPQFRLFPKYDKGIYNIDGKTAIVSAGLGSHTIPIRINNPAQLIVIDLK